MLENFRLTKPDQELHYANLESKTHYYAKWDYPTSKKELFALAHEYAPESIFKVENVTFTSIKKHTTQKGNHLISQNGEVIPNISLKISKSKHYYIKPYHFNRDQ